MMVLGAETIELQMKLRDGCSIIADCRKTDHAAASLIFPVASGMVEMSGHQGKDNSLVVMGASSVDRGRGYLGEMAGRERACVEKAEFELQWQQSMPAASECN